MSKLNSICNICGKVHLNVCQHYNEGKNPYVALVFSCPGEEEKKHGRPIWGQTGANFEQILGVLHSNNIFKWYFQKYDFRITNAYCADSTSEWDNNAIISPDNIERLFEELENTINREGIIICFGKKAELAIDEMCSKMGTFAPHIDVENLKSKIIRTKHPSPTNLAMHKETTIDSIAQDIRDGLKGKTIPAKL